MRKFNQKGRALTNALLATLIVVLYIAISTPTAQSAMSELYNSPVYRGHAEDTLALECAVSWNADALPDMLDLLKDQNVKITFMVSGDWAKENSGLLNKMVQNGHEIGTMGMTPFFDGDRDALVKDIEKSIEVIHAACGVRPELYYSGTRKVSSSTKAAGRVGLVHVMCTVDLLSGRGDAQDILSRALDRPFDGSILLIQPTMEAFKALPACLDGLRQQGYKIGTVSQALG
ncbi:polysaccharide deacetylase family protein [Eubacteriales bacterium OttesenSCG-928-K08]|nr:polysaccharide deacetylase family protein [Eubacteriales bacterium OttesenSCG-928-K08]